MQLNGLNDVFTPNWVLTDCQNSKKNMWILKMGNFKLAKKPCKFFAIPALILNHYGYGKMSLVTQNFYHY